MRISTRWLCGGKGLEVTYFDFNTKTVDTIFDLFEAQELLSDAEDLISELRLFYKEELNDR